MDKPIRILQVFHSMDCGGAENMIMNLYRNIDRSKVQFDFLVHTSKHCFFDDEIELLGGKIYRMPYFNGINIVKYIMSLKTFFSNHPEYKVVHGHLGSCANIYLSVAKKYGCYTIAHSHNTKPKFSLKNLVYRLNTYHVRYIADYFLGCSDAAGLYRYGNRIVENIERYRTVNNAIKVSDYSYNSITRQDVRSKFGMGDSTVIGHVGRFNDQKNHKYLIQIFKEYHATNPNSLLILVGDGELKKEVLQQVESEGLTEYVVFTGIRNDVNKLLQAFDCFVFPSFYEGLPVTLIEAQAAGLPCLISNTITTEVALTDLIHFLGIDETPLTWANNINQIINTNERCKRESEIQSQGYDIDKTTEWIEQFYTNHYFERA